MSRATSASQGYAPRGVPAAVGAAWPSAAPSAALHPARIVAGLVSVAFISRLAVRLAGGETAFVTQGYSLYLDLASNALHGRGLCLENGLACAVRLPIYPVFLMPWIAAGWVYPGVALVQAAIGAATVWLAWRIGRELFDARVGVAAAALAAMSPYTLVHDTSLQDTVLVNFLLAAAAYLLWLGQKHQRIAAWIGGGLTLSLLMLTTGRLTIVMPAIVAWILLSTEAPIAVRVRNAAIVAVLVVVLLGAWTVRNMSIVGAPVLTTEAGESLWLANNEFAMAHFPAESIDLSISDSYGSLTASQQAQFDAVSHDEAVRDQLLRRWAMDYIVTHPTQTIANSARKIWVVISAELSPARGGLMQWGYALMFAPIHLLAVAGWWRHRQDWSVHSLALAIFAAFGVTTAVFWAHTSHKSCLDVFLFVYAASIFRDGDMRTA
jgi:hypothetical protein